MIGRITCRSRRWASEASSATASVPPTWVSGCRRRHRAGPATVSEAASEPGCASMTASTSVTPLPLAATRTALTPLTSRTVAATASPSPRVMT